MYIREWHRSVVEILHTRKVYTCVTLHSEPLQLVEWDVVHRLFTVFILPPEKVNYGLRLESGYVKVILLWLYLSPPVFSEWPLTVLPAKHHVHSSLVYLNYLPLLLLSEGILCVTDPVSHVYLFPSFTRVLVPILKSVVVRPVTRQFLQKGLKR